MTEQPGRPAIRLPPQFAERAREVLDGTVPAVTPRDAATVMLLRPLRPATGGGQPEGGGEIDPELPFIRLALRGLKGGHARHVSLLLTGQKSPRA